MAKTVKASGINVTELQTSADLAEWLDGQPQEISAMIATRAALRAVPVLNHIFWVTRGLPINSNQENIYLAIFRLLLSMQGAIISSEYSSHLDAASEYLLDLIKRTKITAVDELSDSIVCLEEAAASVSLGGSPPVTVSAIKHSASALAGVRVQTLYSHQTITATMHKAAM